MGSYNTAVITTVGQALLTSVLGAQGTMTFTKLQTSSYSYASGTDLSALTSLNNVEQEVNVGSATIVDSTHISASATISNSGISTEYNVNTLGIFASDGVNEVLFAVSTAVTPDVIPVDSGGTPSTYKYKFTLVVSSTSDITISAVGDITANDVSFDNTTSGLPATEVQTAIDDIDAEVDDIVNVYGSKNLLPNKAVTQTINGVTFTVNEDGSIHVTGQVTTGMAYAVLNLVMNFTLKAGTYIFSGVPSNTNGSSYMDFFNGTTSPLLLYVYSESEITATLNSDNVGSFRIVIAESDGQVDYTFYPMLRLASISDSTYAPYSMTNQQITKRLSGQSNRNLTVNGWFTINQRGQNSYSIAAGTYMRTLDCWTVGNNEGATSTLDVNSDGSVTLTNTNPTPTDSYVYVRNKFEDYICKSLIGKQVTFSIKTDTGIYSKTWVPVAGSESRLDLPNGWYFGLITYPSLGINENYVRVWSGANVATPITIYAVKLEFGSVSTLAYDVAPNYAEELLKCQRYLNVFDFTQSSTTAIFTADPSYTVIQLPCEKMRANPSLTISIISGTGFDFTGTPVEDYKAVFSTVHPSAGGYCISGLRTTPGSTGAGMVVCRDGNTRVILDAEL